MKSFNNKKKKTKLYSLINIDVYCQGIQLVEDEKNLTDYDIENEENLVIIPKAKLTNECSMVTSAGKKIFQKQEYQLIFFSLNE